MTSHKTITANIPWALHDGLIRSASGKGISLTSLVIELLECPQPNETDAGGEPYAIVTLKRRNDIANEIMEIKQSLEAKKLYDDEAQNGLITWANQVGFEGAESFVKSLDSINNISISAGENNALSTKIIQWRQAELKPFTIRDICRKYSIKKDRATTVVKFLVMAGFLFANIPEIDNDTRNVQIYSYDILSETERQKQDYSWVKFPFDFIGKDFKNRASVGNSYGLHNNPV